MSGSKSNQNKYENLSNEEDEQEQNDQDKYQQNKSDQLSPTTLDQEVSGEQLDNYTISVDDSKTTENDDKAQDITWSNSLPVNKSPYLFEEKKSKSSPNLSPVSDIAAKLTLSALRNLNFDEPFNASPHKQVEEEQQKENETDGNGDANENIAEVDDKLHSLPVDEQFDTLDDLEYSGDEEIGDSHEDFFNTQDIQDSGMDIGEDSESDRENLQEVEEVDGESDLIVLDPNHPLMKRFQAVYKDHLLKRDEKTTLELRELAAEHNNCKKRREVVGVELYGIQQELAKQQMHLENYHNLYNEQSQLREHCEMQLREIRTLYKQVINDLQHHRKNANELQSEVENLAAKILYMESAKYDARSDINVLKRAAEKAETEVMKAQKEKNRQDLLVNKLVTAIDHLRGDIAMHDAQIEAQREETKAAARTLTEASTELEAIDLEKKQLLQQWNNNLLGMKRRDEAFNATQEAINLQNQEMMTIETELNGFKNQILKAQEHNEHLTYVYNRIQSDIASLKKQIINTQNKHEALKIEYSTYDRTLYETEKLLGKAQTEVTLKQNELVNLRKQIEREFLSKVKLEDMIIDKMQEQLTADKASQYSKKMTDKIRRKAKQLERSVADIENDISKDLLETMHAATRVRNLQDILGNINSVMQEKHDAISKIEHEIRKRNAVIEKKQGTIDLFNKKIEVLMSRHGDESYIGPLEFQIKTFQKQIESTSSECLELQQYWLRQQGELVKILRDVGEQGTEIDTKKKQSTILLQKKLRIEGEINSQRNEIKDIDRNVRAMQNDMTKLNLLIHKNRDKGEALQQDNVLLENDFISTLKEAELNSIQMQNAIQGLNEEKERLLNALVESERQIMLWEKKTQLAREARDAVNSDVGHGEMHAMKAEIHRMEVRYTQLMKQQEKMIQDMEKSVFKRESIIVRGDAQAKIERNKLGRPKENKSKFHQKISELKKKIKQVSSDGERCEEAIQTLRESQQILGSALEEKQTNTQGLQRAIDISESNIERMQELKVKNLSDILTKQQRGKYFSSVKSGKYTMFCKSDRVKQTETEKQVEKHHQLSTIVDRLNSDFPELQTTFRNVTLLLSSTGLATERSEEMEADTA